MKTANLVSIWLILFVSCFSQIIIIQDSSTVTQITFPTFDEYLLIYNKSYTQPEYTLRSQIYAQKIQYLIEINLPFFGVNKFSDWSRQQLYNIRGIQKGLKGSQSHNFITNVNVQEGDTSFIQNINVAKTLDWRLVSAVTSIKDQGQCGSCYAFSSTAFLESQAILRKEATSAVNLAQQFLLMCDPNSGRCGGGFSQKTIQFGIVNGMPTEQQLAYSFIQGSSNASVDQCYGVTPSYTYSNSNSVHFQGLNTDQTIILLQQRPLGVGVCSNINFDNYAPTPSSRTLFCFSNCTFDTLDHQVLLIGYTQTQWIVKNSYGSDYGVDGYVYISRNEDADCGISLDVKTLNYSLPLYQQVLSHTISSRNSPSSNLTNSTETNTLIQSSNGNQNNINSQPTKNGCTDPNCNSCQSTASVCDGCNLGYFVDSITGNCLASTIPNCNVAQICGGSTTCNSCSTGFDLVNNQCTPQVINQNDNGPVSGYCVDVNCQQCNQNINVCDICSDGWSVNSLTGLCEDSRIPNCQVFYKYGGDITCNKCLDGYTLTDNQCQ